MPFANHGGNLLRPKSLYMIFYVCVLINLLFHRSGAYKVNQFFKSLWDFILVALFYLPSQCSRVEFSYLLLLCELDLYRQLVEKDVNCCHFYRTFTIFSLNLLYFNLQEEKILKGVMELRQRQTVSFLNAIEKGVSRKLHEKEIELENMNRKNKELMERIKQVTVEVQSWHYKAKYNESVVNFLRSNLQQAIAQGATNVKEGCGDSEVDDAASYTNVNHLGAVDISGVMKKPINCRACKVREVSVLLLPCRHLCMCKECEAFIELCPVCSVMKTASVQVYMS